MEEFWLDVRDYIGLYQVSNWGRVKSLERDTVSRNQYGSFVRHRKETILVQINNNDYLQVRLWKNGKAETKKVHIIVAEAFIPNPHGYDIVHHKDRNSLNNHVENLEWMSYQQHIDEHKSKTVYQFEDGEIVNVWKSAEEVAEVLGYNRSAINMCCYNNYNREGNNVYKGYRWSYSPL